MMTDQIFQIDNIDVVRQYHLNNYSIEYNGTYDTNQNQTCAIYFSSNNIYFPNNEAAFRARITEKNYFEWYKTRVNSASKHIFLRDIFKQWYLEGINAEICTPELLLEFLKKETKDYEVITIGSSAGGYAAILYGILLNAKQVLSFNGQIEVKSLTTSTTKYENPLLFKYLGSEKEKYFDLRAVIKSNTLTKVFSFYSKKSKWDYEQSVLVRDVGGNSINLIPFITAHHGIPFLKCAIPCVLNMRDSDLSSLISKTHHPLLFTIQQVGVIETVREIFKIATSRLKKSK